MAASFSSHYIILAASIAVLAGLGISRFYILPLPVHLMLGVSTLLIVIGRQRWLGLAGVVLLGTLIGYARGDLFMDRLAAYDQIT